MALLSTEITEGLRIAVSALRERKLRALLTTLGIVIGIVAVTTMFTVINGIEREFNRSMSMIGDDALYVQKMPMIFSFDEMWKYRNRPEISENLASVIRERSEYANAVAPVTGAQFRVRRNGSTLSGVVVEASTPEYINTGGIQLASGRFFTDADQRAARRVVILGEEIVNELFPAENPIGKQIRIGEQVVFGPDAQLGERARVREQQFEVIGTLAHRGKFLGLESMDDRLVIPFATFIKYFNKSDVAIKVTVENLSEMEAAQDELIGIVRIARGLDPMEDDDFAVIKQEQLRELFEVMRLTTYGVGIFLTALSLLVGGIGVMTIMFVSVKDRTREIGIRKALGATQRAILFQFLVEAVLVCLVGGAIGVLLASGIAVLINRVFTAALSPGIVVLAFGICTLVGLIFGIIPARQAARAQPIEALRYE